MKKILLVSAALLLTLPVVYAFKPVAKVPDFTSAGMGLKGNVRSIRSYEEGMADSSYSMTTFHPEGYLDRRVSMRFGFRIEERSVWGPDWRLQTTALVYYDNDVQTDFYKITPVYDEGRIVKMVYVQCQDIYSETYALGGNAGCTDDSHEDTPYGTMEYTYDWQGRLKDYFSQMGDRRPESTRYVYDEQGRIVKETLIMIVGGYDVITHTTYKYDDQGRLVRIEACDKNDNLQSEMNFEYPAVVPNGPEMLVVTGNMLCNTDLKRPIERSSATYYDDQGNAVKVTEKVDMQPERTIITEITYY